MYGLELVMTAMALMRRWCKRGSHMRYLRLYARCSRSTEAWERPWVVLFGSFTPNFPFLFRRPLSASPSCAGASHTTLLSSPSWPVNLWTLRMYLCMYEVQGHQAQPPAALITNQASYIFLLLLNFHDWDFLCFYVGTLHFLHFPFILVSEWVCCLTGSRTTFFILSKTICCCWFIQLVSLISKYVFHLIEVYV